LSSRNALRRSRSYFLLLALVLTGSLGCWEQWSNDWFPQMKWQPAVQAFERVEWQGRVEGFLPPEGSIPISGGEADNSLMTDAEAATLVNPRPRSMASLENGRAQYQVFCVTCHGAGGLGDGAARGTSTTQSAMDGGACPPISGSRPRTAGTS